MGFKNCFKAVLLLLFFSFAYSEVSAQGLKGRARFTAKKRYWSYGGTLTSTNYMGDLAPVNSKGSIDWGSTRAQWGGFIQKRYAPRISARLSLSNMFFAGSDKDAGLNPDRGLSFNTWGFNLNLQGVIDLFPNAGVYYRRPKVPIPYVALGLGAIYSNYTVSQDASADYVGVKITDEMKQGDVFTYNVPLSLGVRYKLSTHLDIGLEGTLNFTGSDKIDGIDNSINGSTFKEFNDVYMTIGFNLAYIMGGTIKMPKFR
ncbi:hypothetical protein KMW28_15670 [Flammeovirga yaeyamensis]|uniref:DUF6089 domain-containing protein n=1 Tax=Flammeovirga yaeyamensis TaxID=367791 RepID=A0AAX1N0M8_9BACT|nr:MULTISPECIES: DUF6089 family protein [Flammeovirga]ANQ47509.1 hypothetical protein MY04_0127 [Flammeovirga sp. MY04]MBB3698548.1 hypothetical protein [Flammeovirga yaeyamensis]NMF34103.1 hypothetical protein [Flammeovirga yaeyamensis]QWG01090.1 hypothetical protein KMW28_15670 [Flammeovirga yaeyamensis]